MEAFKSAMPLGFIWTSATQQLLYSKPGPCLHWHHSLHPSSLHPARRTRHLPSCSLPPQLCPTLPNAPCVALCPQHGPALGQGGVSRRPTDRGSPALAE